MHKEIEDQQLVPRSQEGLREPRVAIRKAQDGEGPKNLKTSTFTSPLGGTCSTIMWCFSTNQKASLR